MGEIQEREREVKRTVRTVLPLSLHLVSRFPESNNIGYFSRRSYPKRFTVVCKQPHYSGVASTMLSTADRE